VFRSCLTSVNLNFRIGHGCFEHKADLLATKFLGNFKLIFIHSFLTGNAFGKGFTIKTDSILIGTKTLQLPARGDAYFRPSTGVTSVGTEKVPFYCVVASVAGEVLPLCLRKCLGSQGGG